MLSVTYRRAVRGWLGGCLTATVVMEAILFILVAVRGGGITARFMGTNIFGIMISLPLVLVLTCLLTGVPAAITIWLGERFQIRSLLFYCWAGAVIGALIQTLLFRSFSPLGWLFVLAGFLAGFDYWFVAGKHAGQEGSFSSNMP